MIALATSQRVGYELSGFAFRADYFLNTSVESANLAAQLTSGAANIVMNFVLSWIGIPIAQRIRGMKKEQTRGVIISAILGIFGCLWLVGDRMNNWGHAIAKTAGFAVNTEDFTAGFPTNPAEAFDLVLIVMLTTFGTAVGILIASWRNNRRICRRIQETQ